MKINYKIAQFFLFILALHSTKVVFGQEIKWAKATWGIAWSNLRSLSIDKYGNCYTTGQYYWNANTFDGTALVGSGNRNAFVSKSNSDGQLIWASSTSSGGYGEPIGTGVCFDNIGNTYISGFFDYSTSFDTITFNAYGTSDGYIAKYDLNGNVIWAKQIGSSPGGDFMYDIEVDENGNCYVVGCFYYPLNIGGSIINGINDGIQNILLAKFDTDGDLVWAKTGKGSAPPLIKVSKSGELLFTGENQHYVKWGNDSISSGGGIDQYFGKLLINGDVAWLIPLSSNASTEVYDFAVDSINNIYFIGQFMDSVTIGDTTISGITGGSNCVSKIDSSGDMKWFTTFAGDTSRYFSNKIIVDYTGNIYTYGEETEIIDITNYWNYLYYGLLRHRFNASTGTIDDVKLFSDIPNPSNIGIDQQNNLYMYGFFNNSAQFEDTVIYYSSTGYLASLGYNTQNVSSITDNSFSLLPNPFSIFVTLQLTNALQSATISIYDIMGKQVKQIQNLNGKEIIIQRDNLKTGMYFFRIEDKNGIVGNGKMVVE